MSQGNNSIEEEAARRNYTKPYGGKHPIPTIQGYRQHRKDIEDRYGDAEDAQEDEEDDHKARRAYGSAKTILKGEDQHEDHGIPYQSANRNDQQRPQNHDQEQQQHHHHQDQSQEKTNKDGQGKSATETAASAVDPRAKRKAMKKTKRGGGREVTDPVTHLPLTIHDQTEKDLNAAPENEPPPGMTARTATGLDGANKSQSELDDEQWEMQRSYNGMQRTFPPPDFNALKKELASIHKIALTTGLGAVLGLSLLVTLGTGMLGSRATSKSHYFLMASISLLALGLGVLAIIGTSGWLQKRVNDVCEDETWDAARQQEQEEADADAELPESVQWLNSWLSSVWPLINPDLFASLVDTLEDVMQASLPKIVRMVSVDDMGQGSESIRILGIKWLPTGAASQTVDDQGRLKKPEKNKSSDRTAQGEGEEQQDADSGSQPDQQDTKQEQQKKQKEQEHEAMRAGMEAEEGDFVNMELAFSYRARSSGKSIRSKAKNAHLYLKFYLPGGVCVPVWVEMRGIMGIMRVVSIFTLNAASAEETQLIIL